MDAEHVITNFISRKDGQEGGLPSPAARQRGMIQQSSVVPGDTKPLPPRFLMKAVFGSDFIYWSSVSLFGKSMSAMFILEEVFNSLSEGERKAMISSLYLAYAG